MDNRTFGSYVKNIEEDTRKVVLSSNKDNGVDRSLRKNCTPIKIKEEEVGDEIQEYAATTISELLGWYGYDKVDSGCTRSLNLDHFTSTSDKRHSQIFQMEKNVIPSKLTLKSPSLNASNLGFEVSNDNLIPMNKQFRSSSLPVKPVSFGSTSNCKYSYETFPSRSYSDNMPCSWCGRTTKPGKGSSAPYVVNTLGHFCSETCFAAGRRAIFKRAKTCDWCRHMQNPDGESQLKFCSEKCLNQYKMNIFCHETQTQLMLQGLNNTSFHDAEKESLITPELWFRTCQSPLDNSTEDTVDLTTSIYDSKTTRKERNDAEKLIESDQKTSRKKDSMCTKRNVRANNCNERRKNFYTELNKHNEEVSTNEKDELCHLASDRTRSKIDSERSDSHYKDFKECNMLNCNLNNRCGNIFLEKSIHVKDIKNLQEKRDLNVPENALQSSPWIIDSTKSMIHRGISDVPRSCTNEFSQTKYQNHAAASPKFLSSKESNSTESSDSLRTALLPPVTILVPYPIPIPVPIPIPIPIPIPKAIFNKLIPEKEEPVVVEDINCKSVECKDSIKNTSFLFDKSQTDARDVSDTDLQRAALDKVCCSSSTSKANDKNSLQQLKQNAKPLRKRKRSIKITNYDHEKTQLKKRNRFIAA
ncbi:uncharacterized protein LOC108629061 isoform X2 [Ceratina calcarata]|uniref:Uncharacterized protein LOC108629061 isoform X2 n=1 Tax=Ceratina calcarata TaxID=156304 RepID=A0AAJ7WDZ0_9HYME|nr:uncharacterized protein LOC108629061 isoform X2 [Ceratina calcarata]